MVFPSICRIDDCGGPEDCPCEALCRQAGGTCNRFPCGHVYAKDEADFNRAEATFDRIMEEIAIYRGRSPEEFIS